MSFVLTQLASDNFHRANQEPLGGGWVTDTSGDHALAILNNACVSDVAGSGFQLYTGVSFPSNQYCSITIGAFGVSSGLTAFAYIRADSTLAASGYYSTLFANGDGTARVDLFDIANNDLGFVNLTSVSAGDVLTLGAVGTTIFVEYNGVVVISVSNSEFSSGTVAIGISLSGASQTSVSLSSFSGGSVANVVPYSVPDCRNYGHFPNSSRNVNGTLIYDVQTSSNSAVPGTDSRKAGAPVSSGVYPQNSRKPGTFGPGE